MKRGYCPNPDHLFVRGGIGTRARIFGHGGSGPWFRDDFTGGAVSSGWQDWDLGHSIVGDDDNETPATSPNVVIIDSPGRAGHKAWQLTIDPTDWVNNDDASTNKERAQLLITDPTTVISGTVHMDHLVNPFIAGTDWWYAWSFRLPSGYTYVSSATKWEVFGQWHSLGVSGGPQPVISIRHNDDGSGTNDSLFVRCGLVETTGTGRDPGAGGETEQTCTFPITRNTWYDIMLHIKWAIGNGNGYVETYVNGVLKAPDLGGTQMVVGTMYNSQPNYFGLGLYEGGNATPHTVAHTVMYESVQIARRREWLRLPA